MNGNNVKMKQNYYARKKRQLKFLAKNLQHLIIDHREDTSGPIEKLVLKIKKLVQELIHVISHIDLKKILGSLAILIGISFTNQASAQSFAAPQSNPFGLNSVYYLASPAFADLDGDGDLDLLVGEYYGAFQYFENIGSASNPQFAAPQVNPFGLNSTYYYAHPAFADLDGDGDLDLLVGEAYGAMQYFENTGSATNPQFAAPQVNPFGLDSTYYYAFPAFADLDGDGDLDLLVGEAYGAMQYFENTGSAASPQFAAPQMNPFGLSSTYYYAVPAFADLDGDGDLDLLVGEVYGAMQYFENTGSASNPQFAAPQVNPFGLDSTYYYAFPAFADLDGDGDMDLLVGEYYGAMQYFENTSIISGITEVSQSLDLKLFPNPVKDVLRIESEEKIEKIEIFDVSGKTLAIIENPTREVSLNKLNPGIYTVRVTFATGNYAVRKVQKQ
ncbi:MAG: T9SS type A sorting domain-containing protein [Bacteroidetes bacterium]|nr:T9SS type A sorting domain-containing protein [Bacteroidota bacterium]